MFQTIIEKDRRIYLVEGPCFFDHFGHIMQIERVPDIRIAPEPDDDPDEPEEEDEDGEDGQG